MKAKLCFTYGFSYGEIETMPACDANIYYRAITVIEAQEMLKQLQIVSYPKTSKEAQQKLHRSLHRQAYPEQYNADKAVSAEQMASILSGLVNG